MHSASFSDVVRELMEDPDVLLFGSVAAPRYGHVVPLAEQVKARSDVTTLHLKPSTRKEVMAEAEAELRKLLEPSAAGDVGVHSQQSKRRRTS